MKLHPVVLKSAEMVTPNVRHLAFARENGEAFDFTAGQFITVHFEHDGQLLRRSYSLASHPENPQLIEFAAAHFDQGPGTELLFNLEAGDKINISGPHGRLILRDEQPKRYILVATGTGVTPYRSMLPELQRRLANQDLNVHVMLGVQGPEHLLYGQDFIDFAQSNERFNFQAFYSRSHSEDPATHENKGYVQHGFENLNLNPENDVVYLCGNPGMIDEAFNLLKEAGFDAKQVRREKYISAKTPAKVKI